MHKRLSIAVLISFLFLSRLPCAEAMQKLAIEDAEAKIRKDWGFDLIIGKEGIAARAFRDATHEARVQEALHVFTDAARDFSLPLTFYVIEDAEGFFAYVLSPSAERRSIVIVQSKAFYDACDITELAGLIAHEVGHVVKGRSDDSNLPHHMGVDQYADGLVGRNAMRSVLEIFRNGIRQYRKRYADLFSKHDAIPEHSPLAGFLPSEEPINARILALTRSLQNAE